jgi:hypothetical protein
VFDEVIVLSDCVNCSTNLALKGKVSLLANLKARRLFVVAR